MKLGKIKAKLAKILCELSQTKTDKGVIEYDGEEIVTGITVYIVSEEGEKTTPEDGDYTLEDGKVLKIVGGIIEEIVEPKEDEEVVEEPKEEEVKAEEEEVVEEPKEDVVEENEIETIKNDIAKLYELVNKILEMVEKTNTDVEEKFSKIEKISASLSAQEILETDNKKNSKLDSKIQKSRELFGEWRTK